jgi:hypothetical protein
MDRRLREVGGQSGVGKGVEVEIRGDQHLLADGTRPGGTRPSQVGQRSRRPGEQHQDSQKRERITFVRAQFRLPPIRSNSSENHDLTFNPMVRLKCVDMIPSAGRVTSANFTRTKTEGNRYRVDALPDRPGDFINKIDKGDPIF